MHEYSFLTAQALVFVETREVAARLCTCLQYKLLDRKTERLVGHG